MSSAMRILVAGIPRCGKSTLAAELQSQSELPCAVRHTDDLIATALDWSAQSLEVSTWFEADGPWIIEGVTVVRALRKWLERRASDSSASPADVVYWSDKPKVALSKGQLTMAKGCATVWGEVRAALLTRGCEIRTF